MESVPSAPEYHCVTHPGSHSCFMSSGNLLLTCDFGGWDIFSYKLLLGPSALMHHTVILPTGLSSGSQAQVPIAPGPTDCCSHTFFLKARKLAFFHVVNLVILPMSKNPLHPLEAERFMDYFF